MSISSNRAGRAVRLITSHEGRPPNKQYTDCNRLNSIRRTPCMDHLTVDHAAAIIFDVTVDRR